MLVREKRYRGRYHVSEPTTVANFVTQVATVEVNGY